MQRALDGADARLGAEVVLKVDNYWHLPVDEAFDMTHEPHDLSHVIGILRALELAARS